MGDMLAVKVLKNALCFIMGYGNTYYVILIGAILCLIHSIGPINVCIEFEINRYTIAKNMQKSCFI